MIERIAFVLALSVATVAAFYTLRYFHMRRMHPAVEGAGLPALLYFHSDTCAACPTQGRIVDQLATQWNSRLYVEHINAEHDLETATRYSVFTLPTTILIDGDGRVRHVNYGLADAHKLGRQLSALYLAEPEIEMRQSSTSQSAQST